MTTVLSQAPQNGTLVTASIAVPLNPDGTLATNPATGQPYKFMHGRAILSDADALNAGYAADVVLYVSYDGLAYVTDPAWQLPWVGGMLDKHGNANVPDLSFSLPADANGKPPVKVRAQIDTKGNTLDIGFTLEITG